MRINKKSLIVILSLVSVFIGLVVGVILVRRRQLIRREAAVPEGIAEVELVPDTQTVQVGETFNVDIVFTTGGPAIAAVTIQLDYPYTGAGPPLTVTDIQPNSQLVGTGDWTFPIKSFEAENGNAQVKIAAINSSFAGYSSDAATVLATLTFSAEEVGSITASFDPTQSKIGEKLTGEDILLIPTSTGYYTVQGAVTPTVTVSPSPTVTGSPAPTSSPTPTPTQGGAEPTSTPTQTPTPTSTEDPDIPDTGVALPTLVTLLLGLLIFSGAGLLFLVD